MTKITSDDVEDFCQKTVNQSGEFREQPKAYKKEETMTDEFKAARDEACDKKWDEVEDWIASDSVAFKYGADWAYEWLNQNIVFGKLLFKIESKHEALQKEADDLAEALEIELNGECKRNCSDEASDACMSANCGFAVRVLKKFKEK